MRRVPTCACVCVCVRACTKGYTAIRIDLTPMAPTNYVYNDFKRAILPEKAIDLLLTSCPLDPAPEIFEKIKPHRAIDHFGFGLGESKMYWWCRRDRDFDRSE